MRLKPPLSNSILVSRFVVRGFSHGEEYTQDDNLLLLMAAAVEPPNVDERRTQDISISSSNAVFRWPLYMYMYINFSSVCIPALQSNAFHSYWYYSHVHDRRFIPNVTARASRRQTDIQPSKRG